MVRVVGFVVLAVAALVVMVALGPSVERVDTSTFDRLVDQALSDAEANEARAQGAPQQQVVNGWTQRDLLTAISRQLSAEVEATQAAAGDQRVPALLLVMVLALCWHGVMPSARATAPSRSESATPVERGPSGSGRDSAASATGTPEERGLQE